MNEDDSYEYDVIMIHLLPAFYTDKHYMSVALIV